MSQARHQDIRKTLDGYRRRGMIERYDWDDQGARYLVWMPHNDGTPVVLTMMATESFIKGVECAEDHHRRTRPDFIGTVTGEAVAVPPDA